MAKAKQAVSEVFNIRIGAADKKKLEALAVAGDRSLAAEIRRAIRLYLEGQQA